MIRLRYLSFHREYVCKCQIFLRIFTPQVLHIIVMERNLDYFTTIIEDRLWQVLAKLVYLIALTYVLVVWRLYLYYNPVL